ncbi:hypothetical protein AQUCO_01000354v1 [Aquilegia coerulea]|uniref:Uncharacterized protein n=1 Tax=Aquilegia coerulea TaxID=218851 RepID=A0A2G5E9J1_AQUCA|nr:hypothetical protein AQUCO_01000354v1 [Aquilegia coerulea]
MSGLIDMWTSELAKLRQKGETMFTNGAKNPPAGTELKSKSIFGSSPLALSPIFHSKPAGTEVIYTEATISMLMDCFSP